MTGPGCYLQVSQIGPIWGPTGEDFFRPFSGRHLSHEKSQTLGDLQQTPGTLGLLLGDHLVTMGICYIDVLYCILAQVGAWASTRMWPNTQLLLPH